MIVILFIIIVVVEYYLHICLLGMLVSVTDGSQQCVKSRLNVLSWTVGDRRGGTERDLKRENRLATDRKLGRVEYIPTRWTFCD
jgi:hypothetical protein